MQNAAFISSRSSSAPNESNPESISGALVMIPVPSMLCTIFKMISFIRIWSQQDRDSASCPLDRFWTGGVFLVEPRIWRCANLSKLLVKSDEVSFENVSRANTLTATAPDEHAEREIASSAHSPCARETPPTPRRSRRLKLVLLFEAMPAHPSQTPHCKLDVVWPRNVSTRADSSSQPLAAQ